MASTVKINLDAQDNASKHIKNVSGEISNLDKKLEQVAQRSRRTNRQLQRIGDATFISAINSAQQSINSLSACVNDLSNAYKIQVQAETQLGEVMRQRMNATDADIDSIKRLASAQQELGVIGDEVQLAGAQQLATFLTQKSSIETLLPAMNNLLAQQKGLNASSGDAYTIANMMGKAMQGQVSALTRVGITMSEAQKEALKMGTEEERAALMAEIITQNVGQMNAKLAQTDVGKQKQLENTLGDIKERAGAVVQSFQPFVTFAAMASTAIGGISTLAMSVAGAAKQYAAWCLRVWDSTKALVTNITTTKASAVANDVLSKSFTVLKAVGVGCFRAIKVALISTGIGAIIWGIGEAVGFLVDKFGDAGDAASKTATEIKRLSAAEEAANAAESEGNRVRAETSAQLTLDIAKLKDFTGTKADEVKVCNDLNAKYGEALGYYSSVAQWYDKLTRYSEVYCEQMVLEAQARQLANGVAEIRNRRGNINSTISPKMLQEMGVNARENANGEVEIEIPFDVTLTPEGAKKIKYDDKSAGIAGGIARNVRARWMKADDFNYFKDVAPNGSSIYNASLRKINPIVSTLVNRLSADEEKVEKQLAEVTKRMAENAKKLAEIRAKGGTSPSISTGTARSNTTVEKELTEYQKINERIDEIKEKALTADETEKAALIAEATKLNKRKAEIQAIWAAIDDAGKAPEVKDTKPLAVEKIETFEQLENAERYWSDLFKKANKDERAEISKTIEALKEKRELMESENAPAATPDIAPEDPLKSVRELYDRLSSLSGKPYTIEIKGIGFQGLQNAINEIDKALPTLSGDARKAAEAMRKEFVRAQRATYDYAGGVKTLWGGTKSLVSGMTSLRETLTGNTSGWEKTSAAIDYAFSAFESISQIVSTFTTILNLLDGVRKATTATTLASSAAEVGAMASTTAAATTDANAQLLDASAKAMNAHSWMPFVGIALGAAAVAAMIATMLSVPKFAKGGIAYGPTLGLFGEYSGASTNPEVVAPLDRLQALLNVNTGGNSVEFKIDHRQLRGILKKSDKYYSKI